MIEFQEVLESGRRGYRLSLIDVIVVSHHATLLVESVHELILCKFEVDVCALADLWLVLPCSNYVFLFDAMSNHRSQNKERKLMLLCECSKWKSKFYAWLVSKAILTARVFCASTQPTFLSVWIV